MAVCNEKDAFDLFQVKMNRASENNRRAQSPNFDHDPSPRFNRQEVISFGSENEVDHAAAEDVVEERKSDG